MGQGFRPAAGLLPGVLVSQKFKELSKLKFFRFLSNVAHALVRAEPTLVSALAPLQP